MGSAQQHKAVGQVVTHGGRTREVRFPAFDIERAARKCCTAYGEELHTDLADFFSASAAFEAALSSLGFRFSFFLPCGASAGAWLSILLAYTDLCVEGTEANHTEFLSVGHKLLTALCSC